MELATDVFNELSAGDFENNRGSNEYGIKKELPLSLEKALRKVKGKLGIEGFGILTEIDMKESRKKTHNQDFPDYFILGAFNPPQPYKTSDGNLINDFLLPCNVVIFKTTEPAGVIVGAIDPVTLVSKTGRDDLNYYARIVKVKLENAIASL